MQSDRSRRQPAEDRFWPKVEKRADGCWIWIGYVHPRCGYGMFHFRDKQGYAHRAAYEMFVGPIPAGLTLDHLCRNRACVNPAHLEPVTCRENILRGNHPNVIIGRSGMCHRGHVFDDKNTLIRPNGTRKCRACHRMRMHDALVRKRCQSYDTGAHKPGCEVAALMALLVTEPAP